MTRRAFLDDAHPLAPVAIPRCAELHRQRGVGARQACGRCWEAAIRADERVALEFGLPAEPPARDEFHVDSIAVEKAIQGHAVRLTRAERLAAVRQMTSEGWLPHHIAVRLRMSGQAVIHVQRRMQASQLSSDDGEAA